MEYDENILGKLNRNELFVQGLKKAKEVGYRTLVVGEMGERFVE